MALTHHYGVVSPAATMPMSLPGRHKSVEKALEGMSGDLTVLKEKQLAAQASRGELEGKVSDVAHHMNDAMSIKHAIGQKEAQLRKDLNKLKGLEREAKHVEKTHESLVTSLHRILEPKLVYAKQRLEKKEMVLQKEQEKAKGWEQKRDTLHDHALETLKEKKVAYASLLQAEERTREAKKGEQISHINYEHQRQKTGQEIQSFRYSETRLKAEVTHEKAAEEATLKAKESVNKLDHVLKVEAEKVDESSEVSKSRISNKIREIERAEEKSKNELAGLQNQYREWQEGQRMRAADVVRKGQDTAIAAQAYAEGQKQVLDTAETKVAREAEINSDWAGDSFSDDAAFPEEGNPSFSD